MSGSTAAAPVDLFVTLLLMRQSVYHAWQRYVQQMPGAGITPEDCWLLLQLSVRPATLPELNDSLSLFVDQPAPLIHTAIDRGWVTQTASEAGATYALTATAKIFLQQILPLAQTANADWREALAGSNGLSSSAGEIDTLLAVLQGRRSTPG